ncbi:MAG: hypothetical protein FVQ83_01485 [Chloroflexi bacterium]|nr:hypothetical protein [Chloroflexota bacterium]
MRDFKRATVHPVLLSIYPVLALFANNQNEIKLSSSLRAFIVSLAATVILLLILRFFFREWQRAALITTLLLILFFSYGHVYNVLRGVSIFGSVLGRHLYLGPLWIIFTAIGVWWILRWLKNPDTITGALNATAIIVIAFPFFQIINFQFRMTTQQSLSELTAEFQEFKLPADQTPPDIYYIILDGYSRDDALLDVYQLDNASFLQSLAESGFYVANCSQSNYALTRLSLSSTLNMDYVEAYYDAVEDSNTSDTGLGAYILNNTVVQVLEALGYQTVAFETGYSWTELTDADVYLAPNQDSVLRKVFFGGLNYFEELLLQSTAISLLSNTANAVGITPTTGISNPDNEHRLRVLHTLDQLVSLTDIPSPKFVFAHIVSPHPPYVFGPDGEAINQVEDNLIGYRNQVEYLNSRIETLVTEIINQSTTPPVIVLQGDHGGGDTSNAQRMSILNAYYLPGDMDQYLYPTITPVNTFRLLFNIYFGAELDLLADLSYFSLYKEPFTFRTIPVSRPGCESASD